MFALLLGHAGDLGLIPGLGRSPGEGKGYPLQYSGQENSMNCLVHGIAKSRTRLNNFHFQWNIYRWTNLRSLTYSRIIWGGGGAGRGQGWRCNKTGQQLILVGAGDGYMRVHYTVLFLQMFVFVVQSPIRVWLFMTPWIAPCQASLSLSPRVCPSSWTLNWWCHPTISVTPFSSCPQSFPVSGPFPVSQLFISGSQSIGASASASVFPMNIQSWFPLGLTDWISLQSSGLSRVFSSTTFQRHQFFSVLPSLWSYSNMHT